MASNPVSSVNASPARRLMPSLEESARGMSVQQTFLEIIARNIANAETTRLPNGKPYQRQVGTARSGANGPTASITTDTSPGRLVYDPGHPDANEQGYVRYPNVDVQKEVVDLMLVRRMYEANATVFNVAKRMLKRAMEI